jgi:tagaturonate reductase
MKMRLRVIPSLQRFVAQRGKVPQALTFGFAAFLMLKREPLRRPDDQGAPIVAAWERHGEDHVSLVEEVCGNVSLWGCDLTALPGVTDAVIAHLEAIRSHGIKAAIPTTN